MCERHIGKSSVGWGAKFVGTDITNGSCIAISIMRASCAALIGGWAVAIASAVNGWTTRKQASISLYLRIGCDAMCISSNVSLPL